MVCRLAAHWVWAYSPDRVGTTRLWRQNTKEVVDLIEAAENRQRTGEAGIIELANGELLLASTNFRGFQDDAAAVLRSCHSYDGGRSWKLSNEIFVPKSGAMEPKIVELRAGRLWMLVRTDQGRLGQSFSTDGGTTWAKADFTNIAAPQAPFIFTRIPSTGDLLLIRNPQVDMTHHHQGSCTPLRCTVSSDEGKTWRFTVDLEEDHSWARSYGSCTYVDDFAILSYDKE